MVVNKYYEFKNITNDKAELYISGEIQSECGIFDDPSECGDNVLTNFINTVQSLKNVKNLDIHVNSVGGDLFAGIQMYNCLKQLSNTNKTVYVDSLAASSASLVSMAGDKIVMPSNAFLMMHKPMVGASGNADDLRKTADMLDQLEDGMLTIYQENSCAGVTTEQIKNMVDNETWLNGVEASKYFKNIELVSQINVLNTANLNFENCSYKQIPKILLVQNPKIEKINIGKAENTENKVDISEVDNALLEFEVLLELNK